MIRDDATTRIQRRLDNLDQFPDEDRGIVVGHGSERATMQRLRVDLHRWNAVHQHMHRVQGHILLVGQFLREFESFLFHSKYFEVAILQQVYKIGELIKHPFVVEIKMRKGIIIQNMIIFRIAFLSAAIFCTWRSYC